MVSSLGEKLQNLSSLSPECCIYRVPQRLRRHVDEEVYAPQVVSIGPFHHHKVDLPAMEEDKMLYLKSFLDRTELSPECYTKFIKERELKVRNSYSETFEGIDSNEFVDMIAVDAAFVIELLWKNYSYKGKELKDNNERILNKALKLAAIKNEMILLENQLPFFIFKDICTLAKLTIPESNEKISLIRTTHKFFKAIAYLGEEGQVLKKFQMDIPESQILHFVDFFRKCHAPTNPALKRKIETLTIPSVTKLQQAGVGFKPLSTDQAEVEIKRYNNSSRTTTGVEFKPSSNGSLLDLNLSKKTLMIPHLRIRKSTESLFLSMIAFEQSLSLDDLYISDYVFVLNRLINATADVELLVESKVIDSKLPDNEEVIRTINNLVRGTSLRRNHFNYFKQLADDLNKQYRSSWNRSITEIKQRHCSSLLTIFAILISLAVFILTLLQTICSCGVQFK